MQIKRFEAKDMTTALRSIKQELGPEAVILSARSLKVENRFLGSTKKTGVEVTAAIDTYASPVSSNSVPYSDALLAAGTIERRSRPSKMIYTDSVRSRVKLPVRRRPPATYGNRHRGQNENALGDIFQYLLSQGVKRSLANDLIEVIKKENPLNRIDSTDKIISKISAALDRKKGELRPTARTKADPKVLAFIGPTGVGKTTALAKLAAKQVIERHRKVAFITIDSYRIAAAAELKIYGNAIGIPVKTAATPSALKAAVNAFRQHDLILVDTPGINSENLSEIENLKSYLDAVPSIEIHLLLSAGAKEADLFNTIGQLGTIPIAYLIFTKLDESATFGNLVNLLVDHHLPLSFLTSGRQVPDSIEIGSVEKVVKCLFGGFRKHLKFHDPASFNQVRRNAAAGSADDNYVANKNSDVFHYPDCKWTQKIKPKNMIRFSSVQEAKSQHFVPCRDCQPDSSDTFQNSTSGNEKMQISNYL